MGGCWSQEQNSFHINGLELIATAFGVQVQQKEGEYIEVRQYHSCGIHQQDGGAGDRVLLVDTVKGLWQWCLQRDIHLRA